MAQKKYYSPKIRRDLVSKLYWLAHSRNIPMTELVDGFVAESLTKYTVKRVRKDRAVPAVQLLLKF
jgi:hypothetical protein